MKKEKFIKFLKSNFIIWAFIAIAVIIELTGVCVTSYKFYIRRPYMLISLLALFSCVLFGIKNQRGRYWCSFIILLVWFVLDLVFIVVFDMTGSTFDYSMLKLRGDAMAILEGIPINFVYVLVCGIIISLYMVLAHHYIPYAPKPERMVHRAAVASVMALVLVFHGGMAYLENYKINPADLSYKLTSGEDGLYTDRGIIGNFVDELYRAAFFNRVALGDENELESAIYSSVNTPTEKEIVFNADKGAQQVFGAAEGYNLVTILGETFEWFSFMHDLVLNDELYGAYPGGFAKALPDKSHEEIENILRKIYPNLYELYDTSVVSLNHHSREKTDISENHTIIGNYPTNSYINYDFPENTIPYSMPNILNALYGVESYSWHDGNYTFYNRNIHHENALGFKRFTASEQMAEMYPDTFTDYGWSQGEHNLDGDMIESCKKEMFPADRRFNTYITTISMHGQFDYRANFIPHYRMLESYGLIDSYVDKNGSLENSKDPFIYYAAATIELDRAIGIMMNYLKNTDDLTRTNPDGSHPKLIDNTLIVLFGDHNAYYQGLTNDVKNLPAQPGRYDERNYTDLFRVPLIVHVGNQTEQVKITKFTCTTDVVPTILDLLGIHYYNSLSYGQSIFTDDESILYSRAYNVFITDKIYFTSINNIRWQDASVDETYIEEVIRPKAVELLTKTSLVNRIFYYDFLSGDRAQTYYSKLTELNS